MKCGKCGGALYYDTDKYGTHQSCRSCGWTRMLTVVPLPDL